MFLLLMAVVCSELLGWDIYNSSKKGPVFFFFFFFKIDMETHSSLSFPPP